VQFRLGALAEAIGGEVLGNADRAVEAIRTLDNAGPLDLSFLTSGRYRDQALASQAGAVLTARDEALDGRDQLVVDDPALGLAQLIDLFHPPAPLVGEVHPTAVLGEGVEIDPAASVGAYSVLGRGTKVGARTSIGAHVSIGDGCGIGEGVTIYPSVVLYDRTVVGDRSILHAGVVVGSDGYGYVSDATGHHKIRHVGHVEIGSDVEIGANSAIDRAVLETTVVGDGTKIDNLVQVGHNVRIGKSCLLVSQSGIAGSSRLGDGVVLAGQSGIAGHLEVGDGVMVAAKSAVFKSIEAGRKVGGVPATDLAAWRRQQVLIARLGEMSRRLRALEDRFEGTED